jgi:hypothetical protein
LREGREWKKKRRRREEEGGKEVGRAIKEGQEIVPCLISWDHYGVQHLFPTRLNTDGSFGPNQIDHRDKILVGNTER